ncbi:MAG: aldo/keto reductase [Ignavibacterium sp.]|nr:aldo/keto reductase [Ignavibacterium sp.]
MEKTSQTNSYLQRYPEIKYKVLGKTGYTASICGFGSYRIDIGVKSHEITLSKALLSGINIIDTSANYSDGGSEKLIGKIVKELIETDKISRNEILIVSKGGYIQGSNFDLASQKESSGKPFPEITKCAPDLWHCIHPEFLEDQIKRSLERLNLERIDIYLLHNPEYFLTYSQITEDERRKKEYYRRIEQAFVHLEKEVSSGRINYYGISSNTFGLPSDKSNFTSLEKVIAIANNISDKNRFAVVQFPLNLFEQGGTLNKNNVNGTKTFLQLAEESNLGVLVNRPLNAIVKNQLIRLADFPVTENRNENEIIELMDDLSKQEENLINKYANFINVTTSERKNLIDCLSLAQILKVNRHSFTSAGNFKEVKIYHLIPRANFAINILGKYFDDENAVRSLRNYAVTVNILLDSIQSSLANKQNEKNRHIHQKLDAYLKDEQKKLSLSQKSVLMLNSLYGVSSTLVGMRNDSYVDDIIGSIKSGFIENPSEFWGKEFIKG